MKSSRGLEIINCVHILLLLDWFRDNWYVVFQGSGCSRQVFDRFNVLPGDMDNNTIFLKWNRMVCRMKSRGWKLKQSTNTIISHHQSMPIFLSFPKLLGSVYYLALYFSKVDPSDFLPTILSHLVKSVLFFLLQLCPSSCCGPSWSFCYPNFCWSP